MTISHRATGTYVNGTANLTPGIPAGAAQGDMMLCFYGTKPYNDAPTITTGWTDAGNATDGTVAAGVDVGSMQVRVFYKEHDGSESDPTITNTTNNVSGAVIIVFQKGSTEQWNKPIAKGGGDSSADTTFSATASANPGILPDDWLVAFAAMRSDAATQSAIGITAAGATIGAFTESPGTDLTTIAGGDMAMSGGYCTCTAGEASAAPIYASTLAGNHTGSMMICRLRVSPIVHVGQWTSASTPHGTGSFVTGSFTPPANSLLVISVSMMLNNSTGDIGQPTISGGSLTYNFQTSARGESLWAMRVNQFTAEVGGSPSSMTITVDDDNNQDIHTYAVTVLAFPSYNTSTPITGIVTSGSADIGDGAETQTLSATPALDDFSIFVITADGNNVPIIPSLPDEWTLAYDVAVLSTGAALATGWRRKSTSTSVAITDVYTAAGALAKAAMYSHIVQAPAAGSDALPMAVDQYRRRRQ